MCGPSSQEKDLANESSTFAGKLRSDYGSRFADQSTTLQTLNNTLSDVRAGKLLPGFDATTLASMKTSLLNRTAGNYANAARAVGGQLAGRGGDSGLESGVDQQIKAQIAAQGAGALTTGQENIDFANAAKQSENTNRYLTGISTLAGEQNPLGYAGAGTSATKSAYDMAQSNAMASSQQFADIAGGVAGIAKAAAAPLSAGISMVAPNADTSMLDAIG